MFASKGAHLPPSNSSSTREIVDDLIVSHIRSSVKGADSVHVTPSRERSDLKVAGKQVCRLQNDVG